MERAAHECSRFQCSNPSTLQQDLLFKRYFDLTFDFYLRKQAQFNHI